MVVSSVKVGVSLIAHCVLHLQQISGLCMALHVNRNKILDLAANIWLCITVVFVLVTKAAYSLIGYAIKNTAFAI